MYPVLYIPQGRIFASFMKGNAVKGEDLTDKWRGELRGLKGGEGGDKSGKC